MAFVFVHMTLSLDGYAAGPGVSVADPMGVGGQDLHKWIFDPDASEADIEALEAVFADTGAVILGRTTFDVGLGEWEDTPYPAPCFVLTHRPQAALAMKSGTFTFVDNVGDALALATEAAGDRGVSLMGVDVARQFVSAGLVDELRLQIAPLVLGDGLPLLRDVGSPTLQPIDVAASPHVAHLRYRVVHDDRAAPAGWPDPA